MVSVLFWNILLYEKNIGNHIAQSDDHNSYSYIHKTFAHGCELGFIFRIHEELVCLEDDDDQYHKRRDSHDPIDDSIEQRERCIRQCCSSYFAEFGGVFVHDFCLFAIDGFDDGFGSYDDEYAERISEDDGHAFFLDVF